MSLQTAQLDSTNFWTGSYFIVLFLLTLPAVKIFVGMEIRIAQIALVVVFLTLLVNDLQGRKAQIGMLLILFFAGVVFMTISSLSLYPKIKENGFIIKYLFIFPAAFYLGQRALVLLQPKGAIKVWESVLLLSCLLSAFVHYYPIAGLIHVRPPYLSIGLKGTFWEQGSLAFFLGLLLLASLAVRFNYKIWPSTRLGMWLVYILVIGCLLASMNKSVWLATWSSLLCVVLFNRGMFTSALGSIPSIDKKAAKRWGLRILGGVCVSILSLVLYNAGLEPQEQIVNEEMLQHKWESERGAVLRAGLDLIAQEPWMGLGFGAVEIATEGFGVGAGAGSGMIFNSFVDIWISVGILGFLFSLWLLVTAYGRRNFPSQIIVVYLFIFGNLNPVIQNEEYYIFLGVAYACAHEV